MNTRKFRLLCLWSPIWLGAALGAVAAFFGYVINPLLPNIQYPEWLQFAVFMPVVAVLSGGLQYIAALCIFFRFTNIEQTKSYFVGLAFLPLYFAVLQLVGMAAVDACQDGIGWQEVAGLLFFVPFSLGVGYAYIAIWLVGEAIIVVYRRVCLAR